MARTCLQCRSSQVDDASATLTFAREGAMPICLLEARLAVCLKCGFAECRIPQEVLAELKRDSQGCFSHQEASIRYTGYRSAIAWN